MKTDEAGAWLGITTGVGGIAGTVLGALAAQRLARTDPSWLLRFPAVTSRLAAPFALLFLTLPASSAPVMTLGVSFFGSCLLGPVLAVTQTLAKVRMRALASALVTLVVNLIGAGLGPLTVGVSSDVVASSFGQGSIRYALLVPAVTAFLWSCALFQSRRTTCGVGARARIRGAERFVSIVTALPEDTSVEPHQSCRCCAGALRVFTRP